MYKLSIDDFSTYFQAVHGYEPFPWQAELARRVVTTGTWPSLLDLPTSAGKTAVIDIGVFHLAVDMEDASLRKAPLRMFFVIDRRIVVDEAYKRAEKISEALRKTDHPVLKAMAARLALLSGDIGNPLDVVRLRGGMPQERDWARSPVQPLVAVSTVDQVGSRLLFRGYGVSNRMRPVHAGLVGSDALWLLDEVHLSQPFEQTLGAIAAGHPRPGTCGLLSEQPRLAPFAVVRLSATPGSGKPEDVFPGSFEMRAGAPKTFLQRLAAEKKALVMEAGASPAVDFVQHALHLLRGEPAIGGKKVRNKGKVAPEENILPVKRLAVVVNRVALARQIFSKLTRAAGDMADVLLLTGRIRPLDRERIMARLQPLFAGVNRPDPDKPVIVVATQTIEAGADFDVDAMVTEIAPLDCLRQRFGRLDRLGQRGSSWAVILCPPGKPVPKSDKSGQRKCPWRQMEVLYGEAPFVTRQWLGKFKGVVDFGVDAMAGILAKVKEDLLGKMLAPRTNAPYLLPPYGGLWNATAPVSTATPEPALFLHGPGKLAEVRVVWRADVRPGNPPASLDLCPPASPEALSVPLWAVRRWLQYQPESFIADVPQIDPHNDQQTARKVRSVLRSDGEGWQWILPGEIRPDDLIVAPTVYGGCDTWGWNPDCMDEVSDCGLEAHYLQRLRCAIRVSFATLANTWKHGKTLSAGSSALDIWRDIASWVRNAGDDVSAGALAQQLLGASVLPESWSALLAVCVKRPMLVSWQDESDHQAGFTLYANSRFPKGILDIPVESEADGSLALTGRRDSSFIGTAVLLTDHSLHVEHLVRDFCSRSATPEALSIVLMLAARLHDLGKAEPRFQADLHGSGALAMNDPLLAALLESGQQLLAKSARTDDGRRKVQRGATPRFFRHEALSVVLAEQHPDVKDLAEEDKDLVLWLIGTHHGFGRPFFPPCFQLASETETRLCFDGLEFMAFAQDSPLRIDQGWFELAERVQRRFGPWELARLEAMLRLADHAASAFEQQNETTFLEAQHG